MTRLLQSAASGCGLPSRALNAARGAACAAAALAGDAASLYRLGGFTAILAGLAATFLVAFARRWSR